ncbi:MAG: hypothetical protein E3J37_10020 [Anaerolineales bacterium]|nr:MAG: hypothetical protein E3J37_10020 [Anaerolineales bacterium]
MGEGGINPVGVIVGVSVTVGVVVAVEGVTWIGVSDGMSWVGDGVAVVSAGARRVATTPAQ